MKRTQRTSCHRGIVSIILLYGHGADVGLSEGQNLFSDSIGHASCCVTNVQRKGCSQHVCFGRVTILGTEH